MTKKILIIIIIGKIYSEQEGFLFETDLPFWDLLPKNENPKFPTAGSLRLPFSDLQKKKIKFQHKHDQYR